MRPDPADDPAERYELRDRTRVFRDRAHAGEVVAGMLAAHRGSSALVLAIPAGGVPVAAAIAEALALPLDVAVVSKITPSWNSEVGYGAVAFDGTVQLNEEAVRRMGLDEAEIHRDTERTLEKVRRRVVELRGAASLPELGGRPVVLVDDGLASGFTMRTAVESLRRAGAERIVVAVPTGSRHAVDTLAPGVTELYCANVRGGFSFAVADAYERWTDVDEREAAASLARWRQRSAGRD